MSDRTKLDTSELNDAEVLALLQSFRVWRQDNPVDRDGLDQMLAFLERHIASGTPVSVGLQGRFLEQLQGLLPRAAACGGDVDLAARYLQGRLAGPLGDLDQDPAALAAAAFLEEPYKADVTDPVATRLEAARNGLFGPVPGQRRMDISKTLRGAREDVAMLPFAVALLGASFNIRLFIDSFQLGHNAWGDGAEIAGRIHDHIHAPASAGQLCSLWPQDCHDPVRVSDMAWIAEPLNRDWIINRFGAPARLPDPIRAVILKAQGGLM